MLIKCNNILRWNKMQEGTFRGLWKQSINWAADSRGDVGHLSSCKKMPSVITEGTLCLAQALRMLWTEQELQRNTSLTYLLRPKGMDIHPWSWQQKPACSYAADTCFNSKLHRQRYIKCEGQGHQENEWLLQRRGRAVKARIGTSTWAMEYEGKQVIICRGKCFQTEWYLCP